MSDTASAARLFRRQQGTPRPAGDQIRAVWAWLNVLRTHYPDRASVEGAYRAAEWAVGITNVPPVRGRTWHLPDLTIEAAFTREGEHEVIKPATTHLIGIEIKAAAEIKDAGADAGQRSYALGAHAMLAWWAGQAELPEWLVPEAITLPRQGVA
jgi:hypothetical protein